MMTQLRCLYLSKNLINKIEGLECLQQLIVLDLSNNHLTKLGNLSCCSSLETLNVSRNALADVESIEHVKGSHIYLPTSLSSHSHICMY